MHSESARSYGTRTANQFFAKLLHLWDNTGMMNIPKWDATNYPSMLYRWYLLPVGTLLTAKLLRIQQPCKTQPPYTRSLDDDCVLYAVVFVTEDTTMPEIFCVNKATKSRVSVFCLLEYHPELGILTDIPSIPDVGSTIVLQKIFHPKR